MAYSEANSYNSLKSVNSAEDGSKKKRVVVVGTGWAGTSFLKNLKNSSYDVQVISPRNYFAFTPLLPSVTCGTVEARSIVEPIRNIVRKVIDLDQSIRTTYCVLETTFSHVVVGLRSGFPLWTSNILLSPASN